MRTFTQLPLILISFFFISGCKSTIDSLNDYIKTDYQYQIISSSDINPDVEKVPSPVVLRVFQLNKLDNFIAMSHADMNLTELEELKTQFLAIDEFFIDPAVVQPAPFNLLETTQYLGVVVSFRDIEKSKWRTWVKIPEEAFFSDLSTKKTFEIVINKLDVVINPPYSKNKEFNSDE